MVHEVRTAFGQCDFATILSYGYYIPADRPADPTPWFAKRKLWVQRTPAIASGLADHIWGPTELFTYKVPLPRWVPPKQRGRRSQRALKLVDSWCS
jgi:hypothetical protein